MLKPQLFIADTKDFCPSLIRPVKNRDQKPFGGLWTSSFDIEYKSGWVSFRESHNFDIPTQKWRGFVLIPKRKVRIYVIDSYDDLKRLVNKYPHQPYKGLPFRYLQDVVFPDYEAISKDYDAIHLTNRGEYQTRNMTYGGAHLYGWDFESTLWFRDCFTRVTRTTFKTNV